MSISKLGEYLKKFSNIKPPHDTVKKQIIKSIDQKFGITLSEKDIQIKNKKIYINTSPLLKNEIFMNKNILLEEIRECSEIIEDIL